jgi:Tol biopolymer transport system component
MKKAGTMFIKNMRYLCLVGVIAIGLMTIVGTGGGGGDGGGDGDGGVVPTKLGFSVQPSIEEQQGTLFSFFVVEVRDQAGERVFTDRDISISLLSGTGALDGTLDKTGADGQAVFDDLTYDQVETIVLEASSDGLASVTATINILSANQVASGLPIERVSVASDGTEGNGSSGDNPYTGDGGRPSLSRDGRLVAFHSLASNLVSGDTNGSRDIFLHDRIAGTTARVSFALDGSQLLYLSFDPSVSANGRFVSFRTGEWGSDSIIHDRHMAETVEFEVRGFTYGNPPFSENNRYIAYTDLSHVYVYDWFWGSSTLVSKASDGTEGNGQSGCPSLTPDGRFVVFYSAAGNLVSNDTNGSGDIFVHDRDADEDGIFDEPGDIRTVRVSVSTAGDQSNAFMDCPPAISADGRYVAFASFASSLVPDDTNAHMDIFVHDRDADEDGIFDESGDILTFRASVSSAGDQADGSSWGPSISLDGRYVVFTSYASNLAPNDNPHDNDVYVHDIINGQTARVSVAGDGTKGNGDASSYSGPAISADGRYIAFQSDATNLVADDNNGWPDVFVAPNPLAP